EVGRGTTFRIYLPRKPGSPYEEATARVAEPGPLGRETILLAEDEPPLRVLMTNLLTGAGYRVLAAASGPQALTLWRAHGPEVRLLVTDIVMPDGMSGFDLAAELVREQPQLPIIYTSGYSPELSGRQDELIAGVNFLPKPFTMDRLLRAIRNALDRPVMESNGRG